MSIDVEKFMRMALTLAEKAKGASLPNPCVGAVIVKDGRVVGQAFHKKAGGAHAEILALKQAGKKAQGAALFCTFEPCAHYGRTGPCAEEIIKSKIKNVYVGMIDPNPVTKGKGIAALKKAGVRVRIGYLQDEIRHLNESFVKAMEQGLPFVTIKVAQSLDGKIATKSGSSQWITQEKTREFTHYLRRYFDAMMVGINTVIKDDPLLELTDAFHSQTFTKIIVDSALKIPLAARLLKTKQPVIIACVRKNKRKEEALKKMGVRVIQTKSNRGRVDLTCFLKELHALEIRNILVEGGAELIGSLLDHKLVDKAQFFVAPKIIGGRKALSSIGGDGIDPLSSAIRLKDMHIENYHGDIFIEGYLIYN